MDDQARAELRARATAWAAGDPDDVTRAELEALVAAGADAELAERVGGELEFGTAGLRGIMGAGSLRMNLAVVLRATFALGEWLARRGAAADGMPVVVGRDARVGSAEFARAVVEVLDARRLPVLVFDEPVPTPLVAWLARVRAAAAAVVVTASHNPPEYNGYKVYGPGASQIVPPADREIAERLAAAPAAREIRRKRASVAAGERSVVSVDEGVFEQYLDQVDAWRARPPSTELTVAYTPLHGVAGRFVARAFERAGYRAFHTVPAQAQPDGRFPTVAFPNPEEPGALDLARALGAEVSADLILANDPDGDRLAACVRDADGYRQLTGNELGILLADHVLLAHPHDPRALCVSTIVSSPMLGALCERRGVRLERTLTGFKWICDAARACEDRGERFLFGYEEALGYTIGNVVRDKDGIAAALHLADRVAALRCQGKTLLLRLDELAREAGLWVSHQHSVHRPGAAGAAALLAAVDRVAAAPPRALAGFDVSAVVDFRTGAGGRPPWLPAAPLVELSLSGAGRVLLRPSGTEPKLKVYVDLRGEVASSDSESLRGPDPRAPDAGLADARQTPEKPGPGLGAQREALVARARAVAEELTRAAGL